MRDLALAGALAVGSVAVLLAVALARRPVLARLALRHQRRRPIEAMMAAAGVSLGVGLLVGAFTLADSVQYSVEQVSAQRLGPVQVVVTFPAANGVEQAERLRRSPAGELVRSSLVLRRIQETVAVGASRETWLAEPRARIVDLDFTAASDFAGSSESGLPTTGPREGEAYLSQDLADELHVGAGTEVQTVVEGRRRGYRVAEVLPRRSLAGFGELEGPVYTIWVPSGTLGGTAGAETLLLLTLESTAPIGDATEAYIAAAVPVLKELGSPPPMITPAGSAIHEQAERVGHGMRTQILEIASFAGAAAIALVASMFVLLFSARSRETGILRALGLGRAGVLAANATEAFLISLVGSLLGCLLGIGIGKIAVSLAQGVVSYSATGLQMEFHAERMSLFAGAAAGLFAGVGAALLAGQGWLRGTPAAALRELEGPGVRLRLTPLILGPVAIGLGIAGASQDLRANVPLFSFLGPPIALAGAAVVLAQTRFRKPALAMAALGSFGWVAWRETTPGVEIAGGGIATVFGVALVLTVAAGVLAATLGPLLAVGCRRLLDRLDARVVALRVAVAEYPARPMRTAYVVTSFAMVVLMLSAVATVTAMEQRDQSRLLGRQAGEWTALVQFGMRASSGGVVEELRSAPSDRQVSRAAGLVTKRVSAHLVASPGEKPISVYGLSQDLLVAGGLLPLASRDAAFGDDAAAWGAVGSAAGDGGEWVVMSKLAFGRIDVRLEGSSVRVRGSGRLMRVAGVADSDLFLPGVFGGADLVEALPGSADRSIALVRLDRGADADSWALEIQGYFAAERAVVTVAGNVIADYLAGRRTLSLLLQVFLLIGLAVGMIGIGVMMAREVRTRRRELAVLRAIGTPRAKVRLSILIEAGILSVAGCGAGALIGAYIGSRLFSEMAAGAAQAVPWLVVLALAAGSSAAGIAGVALPAIQAGRIWPAEELRKAD